MVPPTIGDHDLTYAKIYTLLQSIFLGKLHQKTRNENAAKLLYISKGIYIKDDMFTNVVLGDISVLIYEDYIGKENKGYVIDLAMVNNKPTLFIFSNNLTDQHIPKRVVIGRIYDVFNALLQLYSKQEFINMNYSIYHTISFYAPVVMTIRLVETIYNEPFDLQKDYRDGDFGICRWLDEESLDIIHNCSDSALLEFGALVEHVDQYQDSFFE